MKRIQLKSYAKINICLDVLRRLENGYHEVEMVMQQILLHDDVSVKWKEDPPSGTGMHDDVPVRVIVSTNKPWLPRDNRNLAYQAAELMAGIYGGNRRGTVRIDIKKRIPVAAGLAGGSGNGAAVLHALNHLWKLNLNVKQLCIAGSRLGSDVPFSVMGQAVGNLELGLDRDPLAAHCAIARGTGTDLEPVADGLKSHLVLTKPPIGVSTAEVYQGLRLEEITVHPDTGELIEALRKRDYKIIKKNMINVLENFTLTRYPNVMYTKNKAEKVVGKSSVLMSGSGPAVFGLCRTRNEAQAACEKLRADNRETFWTRTTW